MMILQVSNETKNLGIIYTTQLYGDYNKPIINYKDSPKKSSRMTHGKYPAVLWKNLRGSAK